MPNKCNHIIFALECVKKKSLGYKKRISQIFNNNLNIQFLHNLKKFIDVIYPFK